MERKAENLNTDGCLELVKAIIHQAKRDFMRTKPGTSAREEVEDFFLSEHFEGLTGVDGKVVLPVLHQEYNKKHAKEKKKDDTERISESGCKDN